MRVNFAHRVVACIFIKGDTFLLQHRDQNAPYDPNTWGFFGGHIEDGETPEQALRREIQEELQIEIVPEYYKKDEYDSKWVPSNGTSTLRPSPCRLSSSAGSYARGTTWDFSRLSKRENWR